MSEYTLLLRITKRTHFLLSLRHSCIPTHRIARRLKEPVLCVSTLWIQQYNDIYFYYFLIFLIIIFPFQDTIDKAYIDGIHRKKCLNAFIIEQYSTFIGNASLNSFIDKESSSKGKSFIFFSYIYFLAEIEKSKILSFVEMIRLNK